VETPLDAMEMEPFVHHPHKGCGVELVAPTQPGDPAVDGLVVRKDGVENRFFDLSYRTAPVPGLWYTDKASGRQLGPLNRFHSFADAGDEYEFQTLDSDDDPLGGQGSVELRAVKQHHGYATLQLQEIITVPRGLTRDRKDRAAGLVPVKFDSTVTVFADHPVVNITTTVVNTVKDHKVAALFKLPGKPTALRCGAQFGEVERPVSDQVEEYAIESVPPWHPFREYVASPEAGFALFARGLLEYGTPAAGDDLSLALTLWRSVEWLSRDDLPFRPGHAGPGEFTPEAQCLRTMTFEYGFAALDEKGRLGDGTAYWQAARLFSNPPVAWSATEEALPQPLLQVANPEIVLSSIRVDPDEGIRLTLYNATSASVDARLKAGFNLATVQRIDFLGAPFKSESVAVAGADIEATFGPFEVVCLRVTH